MKLTVSVTLHALGFLALTLSLFVDWLGVVRGEGGVSASPTSVYSVSIDSAAITCSTWRNAAGPDCAILLPSHGASTRVPQILVVVCAGFSLALLFGAVQLGKRTLVALSAAMLGTSVVAQLALVHLLTNLLPVLPRNRWYPGMLLVVVGDLACTLAVGSNFMSVGGEGQIRDVL